jgi:hypothetical protein
MLIVSVSKSIVPSARDARPVGKNRMDMVGSVPFRVHPVFARRSLWRLVFA